MFPANIKSLIQLMDTFSTEEACIQYLEQLRWNGEVRSPFIEGYGVWKCKGGIYRCKKTQKYFTVKTGTVFEKTKVPLRHWFIAMWHIMHFKKGVSSIALSEQLGITQKSAWFMSQKIKRLLEFGFDEMPEEQGIYELDEACFGGLQNNRHIDKKIPNSQGGHGADKTWVFGIFQRNGFFRAFQMPSRDGEFAQAIIRKLISPSSVIITDAWKGYNGLNEEYHHFIVKDGKKDTRNYNPEVHTNNVEGTWATFKRGYNGIYNWWSKKHLKYYLDEFVFRFNNRKNNTFGRLQILLGNAFRKVSYNDILNTTWI